MCADHYKRCNAIPKQSCSQLQHAQAHASEESELRSTSISDVTKTDQDALLCNLKKVQRTRKAFMEIVAMMKKVIK